MEGVFPCLENRIDLLRLFNLDMERMKRISFSEVVPGQTLVHVGQDCGNFVVVVRKTLRSVRGRVIVGYNNHKEGDEITFRVNLDFDVFYNVLEGDMVG